MKKIISLLLALLISGTLIVQTGCYGSFKLTREVYEFNGEVGDKFINTVVFWVFCIIPVYEVTVFLDAVLFNLVEFWTGSNPLAMNEGEIEQQILLSGDKVYEITATKNRFHVEQIRGPHQGEWADLIFDTQAGTCFLSRQGEILKIAEFDPDDMNRLNLFLPGGKMVTVDADSRDTNLVQDYLSGQSPLLVRK